MNEAQKISVVINTYNAEQHLAEVLQAVSDFDETVVCDMESTDRTVEIARQYGCRIVTFPKANHKSAEPARTFAIQSAQSPWVLVVDADEIITPELRAYLYNKVEESDPPAGLYIPRRNRFMGRYTRGGGHDYQLRFFRREGTVWPPYVHTFPQVQGRTEKIPGRYAMLHLADETMRQYVAKLNEYTDNEVEKRASKHYGTWALLWRPAWRFLRMYVLQGGFLSGRRGLMQAQLTAFYQYVAVAKIIEKQMRERL
ncbi:MAG: glycosyltransferase family 2 protein [Prevotella sp.]|nr:glycosyltransferase family 2 protein [Prevotella sp.]